MTIDIKQLRADVRGFDGRFEYDIVDGFGLIDESAVEPWYQLSCDMDRHVAEPIARMLNAVGPLLDEVERLQSLVGKSAEVAAWAQLFAGERAMVNGELKMANEQADSLRRELEEVRAANEQAASTFRQRIDRLAERAQANEDAWRVAITERDSARADLQRVAEWLLTQTFPDDDGTDTYRRAYNNALHDAAKRIKQGRMI